MNKDIPYILRNMVEEDKGHIFTTWLKTFWKVSPMHNCPPDFYLEHQRAIIEKLLETATTQIICAPEDPEYIYGYICYELVAGIMILHWLNIKPNWRRLGLMHSVLTALYPNVGKQAIILTHNIHDMTRLKDKYMLSYNPYYITDRLRGIL